VEAYHVTDPGHQLVHLSHADHVYETRKCPQWRIEVRLTALRSGLEGGVRVRLWWTLTVNPGKAMETYTNDKCQGQRSLSLKDRVKMDGHTDRWTEMIAVPPVLTSSVSMSSYGSSPTFSCSPTVALFTILLSCKVLQL